MKKFDWRQTIRKPVKSTFFPIEAYADSTPTHSRTHPRSIHNRNQLLLPLHVRCMEFAFWWTHLQRWRLQALLVATIFLFLLLYISLVIKTAAGSFFISSCVSLFFNFFFVLSLILIFFLFHYWFLLKGKAKQCNLYIASSFIFTFMPRALERRLKYKLSRSCLGSAALKKKHR